MPQGSQSRKRDIFARINHMAEIKLKKIKPQSWKEEMKEIGHGENDKHLPNVSFSLADLPDAKSWRVDGEYVLKLHVRQTALSQRKDGRGNVSFDILAAGGAPYQKQKGEKKRYPRAN